MLAEWAIRFQSEFGNAASYCVIVVFLSTIPFCAYKRHWPEIQPTVVLLISSAGAISAFKVVVLMMLLPLSQLGSLSDDKPVLMLGGVVMLVVLLRAATVSWRKLACI